eukprot:g1978.t1
MSSVLLGDLSDYISPSQACVNPIFTNSAKSSKKKEETKKKDDKKSGGEGGAVKITIDLDDEVDITKKKKNTWGSIKETVMQTAQITLNDCLACSGCVTSAETVLIEQQSAKAFYEEARSSKRKLLVISISEEARASLANHFNVSSGDVHWKLRSFFVNAWKDRRGGMKRDRHGTEKKKKMTDGGDEEDDDTLRDVVVLDASAATDVALVESRLEFIERFRNRKEAKWAKPAMRSMAVSATKERVLVPGATIDFDDAAEHARTAAQSAAVVAASLPSAKRARDPGPYMALPMIVSACPGWVCYAEKRHPEVLPFMSSTKSPQQILGTFAKLRLPRLLGRSDVSPSEVLHVSVMACFDKKLEASRLDFWHEGKDDEEEDGMWRSNDAAHECDLVLTSGEIVNMLKDANTSFIDDLDVVVPIASDIEWKLSNFHSKDLLHSSSDASLGSSGGFVDHIFRWAARELFELSVEDGPLEYTSPRRCNDDFKEVRLVDPKDPKKKVLLRFAVVYGFRHIQRIVRQMRSGTCKYDLVEMMACPGGCLNGGGQVKPKDFVSVDAGKLLAATSKPFLESRSKKLVRDPSTAPLAKSMATWLGKPFGANARKYLHTRYHAIPEMPKNPLAIAW